MGLQRRGYAECFSFMSYAPIIFISAQTGYNIDRLMRLIREVDTQTGARVPTGVLNEMLARATARVQPPTDKGRRLKIFYLTQASTRPPTFVAFVNSKPLFHFSYQRYLINQIRESFSLEHTPIRLVVRERGTGQVGAKDVCVSLGSPPALPDGCLLRYAGEAGAGALPPAGAEKGERAQKGDKLCWWTF